MKFIRLPHFCFLFLIANYGLQAQNYAKKIKDVTWYCNCDFKKDTIKLFETNTGNYQWQLSFGPDGKVSLLDLKRKISNTAYSYEAHKSTLKLFYDSKDSLANLDYIILKNKKAHSFELALYYDLRYKKRKATDTPPVGTFMLSKGTKTVNFERMQEITVFRTKKGLKHDSIEVISKGHFLEIRNDTLVLNAYQYSVHNFYKRYPDTNHYYSESLFDTLIRIKSPLKEITKIHSQREALTRIVNTAAITALGVFFVSFPIAVTVKSSDIAGTAGDIAIVSAASIPLIVSVNMLFSKQKFQIRPTETNKDVWRIDYKK